MTIHNPFAHKHAEVPNPPAAYCHGKQAFETPQLAWEVAKGRKSRGDRVAYRCDRCNRWHVAGRPG